VANNQRRFKLLDSTDNSPSRSDLDFVIKTDTDGRQYLGVPGVSEPQERMMAGIFGFTEFEPAAPANAADVDSGVFGYWFCQL